MKKQKSIEVLVIEADDDAREEMKKFLEGVGGFNVLAISRLYAAQTLIEEARPPFDVVVIGDVAHNIAWVRRVRAAHPTLQMSGRSKDARVALQLHGAGCNGASSGPISPDYANILRRMASGET